MMSELSRNPNLNADTSGLGNAEKELERVLRPRVFSDFTGQQKTIDNLKVFVTAARQRGEALDHVLLHGPPGLGKTTLASIIAKFEGMFTLKSISTNCSNGNY